MPSRLNRLVASGINLLEAAKTRYRSEKKGEKLRQLEVDVHAIARKIQALDTKEDRFLEQVELAAKGLLRMVAGQREVKQQRVAEVTRLVEKVVEVARPDPEAAE